WRGIDDWPLAVMPLELVHEDLHLFPNLRRRRPSLARRIAVPFNIDHRWKRIGILGNVTDEPVGLLARYATPVEEMVCAAFYACGFRLAPVFAEHRVEMVTAIGCLDIGEVCALGAQFHPVDIALPARYVHAMYGQLAWRRTPKIDRFCIAETVAIDLRAFLRCKAHRWIGCNLRLRNRDARLWALLWLRLRRNGGWRLSLERTCIRYGAGPSQDFFLLGYRHRLRCTHHFAQGSGRNRSSHRTRCLS